MVNFSDTARALTILDEELRKLEEERRLLVSKTQQLDATITTLRQVGLALLSEGVN